MADKATTHAKNRHEIRIRVDAGDDLLDRLRAAAAERLLSPQVLATRAIRAYLADLVPVADLALTYSEQHRQGSAVGGPS